MSDSSAAPKGDATLCPAWLAERLQRQGGSVPFRTYMDWVLHDPDHGAYASGRLRIGPQGDFTTAPSLGDDFAALLAPQLALWLEQLGPGPLALVEAGPGEGTLAADLARQLADGWPELAARTELVLVDPSGGLVERQRRRLQDGPLPTRWCSFAELAARPLVGVVLAHEVLDALPVERIVWDGAQWRRQRVALRTDCATAPEDTPASGDDSRPPERLAGVAPGGVELKADAHEASQGLEWINLERISLELSGGEPLDPEALQRLAALGLSDPGAQRPCGWATELHPELEPWLVSCGAALQRGVLLVIDYGMEAFRYYAPQRSSGTLMGYRAQQASSDPLRDPGHWDLTAHLCLESLAMAADAAGWQPLGSCRQGQALLALGLAQRLHGLQQASSASLADLLLRREALLRLVDPAALGDFRWVAFARGEGVPAAPPLFLQDPPLA